MCSFISPQELVNELCQLRKLYDSTVIELERIQEAHIGDQTELEHLRADAHEAHAQEHGCSNTTLVQTELACKSGGYEKTSPADGNADSVDMLGKAVAVAVDGCAGCSSSEFELLRSELNSSNWRLEEFTAEVKALQNQVRGGFVKGARSGGDVCVRDTQAAAHWVCLNLFNLLDSWRSHHQNGGVK